MLGIATGVLAAKAAIPLVGWCAGTSAVAAKNLFRILFVK